jgi:hypothetical protein
MGIETERFVKLAPYVGNVNEALEFADRYSVPSEDILLLALNLSGFHYGNTPNDRGRFRLTVPGGRAYRMATTITNLPVTNFNYVGRKILLGDYEVGSVPVVKKDTCTDTYWRSENHLTLNSNSRSLCRGCDFCGTYQLESAEKNLTDIGTLEAEAKILAKQAGSFDKVDAIGIVTGCFNDENKLVEHIKNVRHVFSQVGFRGEIQYVGSQLRSTKALSDLIDDGPFALYLTLEIFSNREKSMKRQKSSLDLDASRTLLDSAKKMGANTSFLYICGLDSLSTFREELPKFEGLVTRLPLFQTYQLYTPEQILLRSNEASKLDYFLGMRQTVEKIFPDMKPVLHHNYRGLWYTKYKEDNI